ncbi:MAG: hypothetical protein GX201_01005 [Clostridiales bacterium]|nr:hypothetical protein [Clostridiales bacterium]
MYRKIYSKSICLGLSWGIFAWIDFFKHNDMPSLIGSVPVFLSLGIGKAILNENIVPYDKNFFILSILCGGFIGFIIGYIFKTIISIIQED